MKKDEWKEKGKIQSEKRNGNDAAIVGFEGGTIHVAPLIFLSFFFVISYDCPKSISLL